MAKERTIEEVIAAARLIQDYLWGEQNTQWSIEEWRRMFRKRVAKIDAVNLERPHAGVELRKRFLQAGALAVAFLERLDAGGLLGTVQDIPSNLPEYVVPSPCRKDVPDA